MIRWERNGSTIRAYRDDVIAFEDTTDHFVNGVSRLLGADESALRRFVELAIEDGPLADSEDEVVVAALQRAATGAFGAAPEALSLPTVSGGTVVSALGHVADRVIVPAIPEADGVFVAGSTKAAIGWLVDRSTMRPPDGALVAYEDTYFEGGIAKLGYGNYLDQQGWRLEKAARYLRRIRNILALSEIDAPLRPRVLDIGSGYGFFRKAAADAGWEHDGLEVSAHAAAVAKELFGFDTIVGTLDDHADEIGPEAYDIVTMWDVVEHVADPLRLLRETAALLRPGGVLFLRTPNIDALEFDVFGWRYHSFKLEHLYYFGPPSLTRALERSGFGIVSMATDSHLLAGLLHERLQGYAARLRGSDFFVAARRLR